HRYQQTGSYRVFETWYNQRTQVTRTWLLFEVRIGSAATRGVHPTLSWRVGRRFAGGAAPYSGPGGRAFPATLKARVLSGGRRAAQVGHGAPPARRDRGDWAPHLAHAAAQPARGLARRPEQRRRADAAARTRRGLGGAQRGVGDARPPVLGHRVLHDAADVR